MAKLPALALSRAMVLAVTFALTAIVLSFFPIGPFYSLLTTRPNSLQLPRIVTILAFAVTIGWALRGAYRPAQRTTIVVLGSLVLSDFALVVAYLIARLH